MVIGRERRAYLQVGQHFGSQRFGQGYALLPCPFVARDAAHQDDGALRVRQPCGCLFDQLLRGARRRRRQKPLRVEMMGVPDKFGESGEPWELMKVFGLTAKHVARKALELLARK